MKTAAHPETETHPLAQLGHELLTPLNAIIGYAEAMILGVFGPLAAPYDEHAATIHRAALHMRALVDDINDLAQAEAGVWTGPRSTFNAVALAQEVVTLLASRAALGEVAVSVTDEAGLADILADRRAIRQILLNLLDNALRFTARGGAIAVTLDRDDGALRLVVADTGGAEGSKGSGLGLRLVRALSLAHGGSVAIDHRADGGVSVTVRLPVLTEP